MKLVLGSKSPRRQALLADLGYSFETRTKDTDESFPSDMNPRNVPEFLANVKANALLETLQADEVLITSDTIVLLENQILGKPADASEAIAMLHQLSGKKHEVITGVQLTSREKSRSFSVTTAVFFNALTQAQIEKYVTEFKPFDKAGSYGIQEWIGFIGVSRIEGSYFNVMGLPLAELYVELEEF